MSQVPVTVPTLDELLNRSAATPEFAVALRAFAQTPRQSDHIRLSGGCPPVKVQRVIMQALEKYPSEPIRSVSITAQSGCSDFRGTLVIEGTSTRTIAFVWDCAWRASEQGWKTFWGDPDQQRAAREFGYQCFEVFAEV